MDGFKQAKKIKYFKVGGSVSNEKFKPSGDAVKTIKTPVTGNKKANAKSAPVDKEAKVDITTMKKGGRAKKAVGTVKKFAAAPSKAAVKAKGKVKETKPSGNKDKIKKGKTIKKFADGGLTGAKIVIPDPNNPGNYINDPNTPPMDDTPFYGPKTATPIQQTTLPPDLATPMPRADGTYGPVGQKPSIQQQVTSGPSNGEEFGIPAPRMPTSTPPQMPMFQPRTTPTPQMRPATTPMPNTGPPLPGPSGTSQFMGGNPFRPRTQVSPAPNPINKLISPVSPLPGRRFKTGGKVK